MRFLYVCPDPGVPVLGRKGASVHIRALVRALRDAGHHVALAAASLVRSPWEKPVELEGPLLHVPPSPCATDTMAALTDAAEARGVATAVPGEVRRLLFDDEFARELVRRFRGEPPSVVYERASLHALSGAVVAGALDVPRLIEMNAPLALEQAEYRGSGLEELAAAAERQALVDADAVIVVSAPLRDHALALGVAPERVHVMPNGVDASIFHPDGGGNGVFTRNGGPVLGFVGGLRAWHGVDTLPRLLARLVPVHPDVQLVIVGDGPSRVALEREFERGGLADRVVFTGSVAHEDVPGVMRQFDVALAPYPKPAHEFYFSPLKLFEYMACAAPVVAPRLGQIAEIVRDGETGLLYEPAEVEPLARACERLLGDEQLRRRLGATAASVVRERYTWDRNAQRVVEIARDVIEARRRR